MKAHFAQSVALAAVVVLALACAPAAAPVAAPAPASTAAATLSPSPTATAGLTFNIQAGVSGDEVAHIRDGIAKAAASLQASLGVDNPRPISVNVVSGGSPNCCTADGSTRSAGVMNFDVAHPDWTRQLPADKRKIVAHEYTHTWQADRGCLNPAAPIWFTEGMAEYLAYEAMVLGGLMDASGVRSQMTRNVKNAPTVEALQTLETKHPMGVNAIASLYLAVGQLIARPGLRSLRTFCEAIGTGQPWQQGFQPAFGVTVEGFYGQFEAYRSTIRAP